MCRKFDQIFQCKNSACLVVDIPLSYFVCAVLNQHVWGQCSTLHGINTYLLPNKGDFPIHLLLPSCAWKADTGPIFKCFCARFSYNCYYCCNCLNCLKITSATMETVFAAIQTISMVVTCNYHHCWTVIMMPK